MWVDDTPAEILLFMNSAVIYFRTWPMIANKMAEIVIYSCRKLDSKDTYNSNLSILKIQLTVTLFGLCNCHLWV